MNAGFNARLLGGKLFANISAAAILDKTSPNQKKRHTTFFPIVHGHEFDFWVENNERTKPFSTTSVVGVSSDGRAIWAREEGGFPE